MTKLTCEARQFKKFVEAITTLNSESRLHVSKDGIETILVDAGNVAMVNVKFQAASTKSYKYSSKEKEMIIGIDYSRIARILSVAKPNTPLTVEFATKRLVLTYGEIKACVEYVDANTMRKDPNPSNVVLKAELSFEGDVLTKFGRIMSGNTAAFVVKNGIASIIYEYGDETSGKMFIAQDVKGSFRALYSWDYLKDIAKVLKGASVSMRFDNDYPMLLETTMNGVYIKYLLAPRIESE